MGLGHSLSEFGDLGFLVFRFSPALRNCLEAELGFRV